MKKINSNDLGGKVVGVIVMFCFIVPVLCYLLRKLFGFIPARILIIISLVIGGCISFFSIIILIIEFRQDRKLDMFYKNHRNSKMQLEDGILECQNCGNRKIKENDSFCASCGVVFTDYIDKAPY
ncbi:hypothetical protein [Clostridium oryzae]|uniref:Double zinc ribbon n=1 Tax=Clostridium oryzae TaxID=1450648 RepID=A0A1V4IRZ6_9CLOT|nr:hypothetical protein [Clostridium oryzae]OPJ62590.1 hypothetical protein CLORY_17200 [Clostridium oryzae]